MSEFENLMKTACSIKSHQLNQDKKQFDSLPDFYKSGLYCCDMTRNVRKQEYHLRKCSFEILRQRSTELIAQRQYDDAHYLLSKVN